MIIAQFFFQSVMWLSPLTTSRLGESGNVWNFPVMRSSFASDCTASCLILGGMDFFGQNEYAAANNGKQAGSTKFKKATIFTYCFLRAHPTTYGNLQQNVELYHFLLNFGNFILAQ